MKIDLPFREDMRYAIKKLGKIKTSRTSKMGEVDDTFDVDGDEYIITSIVKMKLGIVAEKYFREEGFISQEEFWFVWGQIHNRTTWEPEQIVFVHTFEKVKKNG